MGASPRKVNPKPDKNVASLPKRLSWRHTQKKGKEGRKEKKEKEREKGREKEREKGREKERKKERKREREREREKERKKKEGKERKKKRERERERERRKDKKKEREREGGRGINGRGVPSGGGLKWWTISIQNVRFSPRQNSQALLSSGIMARWGDSWELKSTSLKVAKVGHPSLSYPWEQNYLRGWQETSPI
ncbi:hypothetical protein L345_10656, partial [Ophiophagus hannah]